MESHQQVMFSNSSVVAQPFEPQPNSLAPNSGHSSNDGQRKESLVGIPKEFIGVLEVFIHQARDIRNICIYHKQDVYAKLCLTSDPERTVSTQTINGAGQNPVFNENLRLNVQTVDSSLKCEIWMLSRIRNYLQDQLLGIALVPLSNVLIDNGELAQEFELSSSDLFHSPSGFLKLTLKYTGSLPEVLEIPVLPTSLAVNANSSSCKLGKIEFPDPKIANENEMMVTEYYAIPCPKVDCQSLENCDTTEKVIHISLDADGYVRERYAKESDNTVVVPKVENPSSSVSAKVVPTISESVCDTLRASKLLNEGVVPCLKGKKENVGAAESGISTFARPVISVNVEPEQKVVQQEIVDIYMKSMKQFTEALAKMKLPLDIENESADSGNTDSDGKVQASKGKGPSLKVLYGSRAFF